MIWQTSPTSISKISTPRPHQSTALVYDDSVRTSGAKNSGVPQNVEVRSPKPIPSLQSPKSAILTKPSASRSKLSSFKSLQQNTDYMCWYDVMKYTTKSRALLLLLLLLIALYCIINVQTVKRYSNGKLT